MINVVKILISVCLLLSNRINAQTYKASNDQSISNFSCYLGINSVIYFDDEYTADTLSSPVAQGGYYVYKFKRIPSISFETGMYFSHSFRNKISLWTGLNYVQRRKKKKKNQVSYYDAGFENVTKSLYKYDNFEIPALLGLSFGNFKIKGGVMFPIVSFESRRLITDNGDNSKVTSEIYLIGSNSSWFYPCLHLNYDIMITRYVVSPFLSIDYTDYIYFPFFHIGALLTISKG